jgi:hypothetical protein
MYKGSQSRKRKPSHADVNKSLEIDSNILEKSQTVRFDIEKPFPVRLELPEKITLESVDKSNDKITDKLSTKNNGEELLWRLRNTLTVIVLILILSIFGLRTYILGFRNTVQSQNIPPEINLVNISPKYLLQGDQNTVDITVTNLHPSKSFSGLIILTFSNPNIPIVLAPDQNNLSITITNLRPNDRTTGQFRFILPAGSSIHNVVYYFQILQLDGTPYISPNGTPYNSIEENFKVFPVPYLATIWVFITSTGILGTVISWSDQIRKLFNTK